MRQNIKESKSKKHFKKGNVNPGKSVASKISTPNKNNSSYFDKYQYLLILLTMAVGAAIYSNSFDCSFHFDDSNIFRNTVTNNFAGFSDWIKLFPSRPLGILTFAINYHFHQMDVWGYHLINLLIHLINTVLVSYLTLLTFSTPAMNHEDSRKHKLWIAFLTGLLFVSHPLATQSVTYIAQRFASLATLFYLLSMVFYMRGRMHTGKRIVWWFFYAVSLFSAVMGILTKEIVFTLPFAILLYEISFFKIDEGKFRIKAESIILAALMLTIFLLWFFRIHSGNIFATVPPDQGYDYPISSGQYFLTQFRVITTYLRLFLLPIHQTLDYYYPVSHSLMEPETFLCLLFLVGIASLGLLAFKKYRLIFFGIFWFFLTLSVESSIIPVSQNVIFEHRTYLPSFGVFLVLTSAIFYLPKDLYRKTAIGILAVMIMANAVLTYQRNEVWKNEQTLWSDCVSKSPLKSRAWLNLGKALADNGAHTDAVKYYDQSIGLNPKDEMAFVNRAKSKIDLNDCIGAAADLNTALKINPKCYDANVGMGETMICLGKTDDGLKFYQQALKIKPYAPDIYYNIGIIMVMSKRHPEAIENFNQAIRLKPDYATAHNNLGTVLLMTGNITAAITHFREALRLKPNYDKARRNLQDSLDMMKQEQNSR